MLSKSGNSRDGSWSRPFTLAVWSGLLLLLVFILASCSKAPDAEISAAESAIQRADETDARSYAAEELAAAEDSLAMARSEVDRQNADAVL